jgi:hypothetical protein
MGGSPDVVLLVDLRGIAAVVLLPGHPITGNARDTADPSVVYLCGPA